MNLLDLFEADITDIPPSMRRPLTMRDIEDLKPQGVFPYVVVHKDGHKEPFMDLAAAKQQARAEGGKVYKRHPSTGQLSDINEVKKKISEAEGTLATGIANYMKVRKTANTDEPVYLQLDTGQKRIEDKYTKRAIVKQYERALEKDATERRTAPSEPADLFGKPEQPETSARGRFQQGFLLAMTTESGLAKILAPYIEAIKRNKEFARTGGSLPGQRGYQEKLPQDFNFDESINEDDIESDSARTQKILRQIRAQQPQARTDAEAIAYAFVDAQKKDQEAIDKLERELDDVENDVQKDLRQQISQLRKRREKIQSKGAERSSVDDRQDALLKRLDQVNAMQTKAIDDLEQEIDDVVAKQPRQAAARPIQTIQVSPTAPAAKPAAAKAVKQRAQQSKQARQIRRAQQELDKDIPDLDDAGMDAANDPQQRLVADKYTESLRPGEWHNAEVTFDDGTKRIVRITTDEGFRDMITQHFAKQGKKVVDIDVDWSVRSVNEADKKPKPTNPQLWGRAKAAAKSKFDVYPSAYANAWAAKWYKSHGGGWR